MPKVLPEYKEQARRRIIEAAAAVFQRQGLLAGTMDEIAREIGVSKGALYLYFPTKVRLLEAVQGRFRAQFVELLEHRLASGDVAEGIVSSVHAFFDGQLDRGVWHQLIVSASEDPEVRGALRADDREDRRWLRRLLRRFERERRIPPMRDVEATVDAVVLLLTGTMAAAAMRADPRENRAQLLRATRLVLGLPTRPSRGRP